jgi:outer membrane protein assembly factor BamB
MVSGEKGLPVTWSYDPDPKKNIPRKNVKWVAELGSMTNGTPTVAGGRVYIGTNNERPRDPAVKGDRGILMCFSEADGKFLWQAVHEKLYPTDKTKADAEDYAFIGICSTPAVAADRVYYVSNRAELVSRAAKDGSLVWMLDMRKELGVTPYQASASSPLVVGDLVFAVTGQGSDYSDHGKVKNPAAPSFIAVEASTGRVVWKDASPGARIITGQWGSPSYGLVDGHPQVAFPGGDGWLYAFEPRTGKLLWKFNCKAHEKVKEDGTSETANELIGAPVYFDGKVFIAIGEHPDVGGGNPGCLRAIDASKRGDITKDGELWRLEGANFGRTISNMVVEGQVVWAVELEGFLNCIDRFSGRIIWRYDLMSTCYGSPLVADGKVYLRTGEGDVKVFEAKKTLKVLAERNTVPGLFQGSVVVANGVLFMAGGEADSSGPTRLYAIALDK